MSLLVLFVCGFFGWSLGRTSNGMTSPRVAFNIYTGPFAGVLGAIIGLIYGLFAGAVVASLFTGFGVGLVAGLVGLGLARLSRNLHN